MRRVLCAGAMMLVAFASPVAHAATQASGADGDYAGGQGQTIKSNFGLNLFDGIGAQADGMWGHWEHSDIWSLGGHLFWHDRAIGTFGGFASHANWAGLHIDRGAFQ